MMTTIPAADPSLLEASPTELMALFRTLLAPPIEEMHGEFNATMLTQKSLFGDLTWRVAIYTPIWPGAGSARPSGR